MLANPNWKYRNAALMAISAVGEGCQRQMESLLPQIIDGVLNFLQDSVSLLLLILVFCVNMD